MKEKTFLMIFPIALFLSQIYSSHGRIPMDELVLTPGPLCHEEAGERSWRKGLAQGESLLDTDWSYYGESLINKCQKVKKLEDVLHSFKDQYENFFPLERETLLPLDGPISDEEIIEARPETIRLDPEEKMLACYLEGKVRGGIKKAVELSNLCEGFGVSMGLKDGVMVGLQQGDLFCRVHGRLTQTAGMGRKVEGLDYNIKIPDLVDFLSAYKDYHSYACREVFIRRIIRKCGSSIGEVISPVSIRFSTNEIFESFHEFAKLCGL